MGTRRSNSPVLNRWRSPRPCLEARPLSRFATAIRKSQNANLASLIIFTHPAADGSGEVIGVQGERLRLPRMRLSGRGQRLASLGLIAAVGAALASPTAAPGATGPTFCDRTIVAKVPSFTGWEPKRTADSGSAHPASA